MKLRQKSLVQLKRHLFSINTRYYAMWCGYKYILRELTVKRHSQKLLNFIYGNDRKAQDAVGPEIHIRKQQDWEKDN